MRKRRASSLREKDARAGTTRAWAATLDVRFAEACPDSMDAAGAIAEALFPALKPRFDVPAGTFRRQQRRPDGSEDWLVWRAYDVPDDPELLLILQEPDRYSAHAESAFTKELQAMVESMRFLEPGVKADLLATAEMSRKAGLQ